MDSTPSGEIAWAQGGTAMFEALDGERVRLRSTRAFAPGSRPEGTVLLGPAPITIWIKVHGSRGKADQSYEVIGKLLNVTREVREKLKEAVRPVNSGKTPDP